MPVLVALAAVTGRPVVGLSSLGWTLVAIVAGLAYVALLVVAFSLMLRREGLGTGGKIVWAWIIILFPYVGALISILVDLLHRRPTQ